MNQCFVLHLTAPPGALLRVLGVIERRGFRVLGCTTVDHDDGYRIHLNIRGSRGPQLLCRQLARLMDVHGAVWEDGGVDGTRTRDPRRDRPVF